MLNPAPAAELFAYRVVAWQKKSGRHDLPWQNTRDPYRIWLSEIMLQQTQVGTVIRYYQRFLARFPDVRTLARAAPDEVMPYWAGLGYYARARNLHRCACAVVEHWNGDFPRHVDDMARLPGIGPSTAAAIAAFAFGGRHPIMDGNVKRVFTRYFGIAGDPGRRAVEKNLWDIAETVIVDAAHEFNIACYTQGLMDLGATVCSRTRPRCDACPLASTCYARRTQNQGQFPERKAKKKAPQRQCQMLILHRDGHVFLEQRPAPGIWGGLWCLPQYDNKNTMRTALLNFGLRSGLERPLDPFKHAFSHFTLCIEPWLVHVDAAVSREPLPTEDWKSLKTLDTVALPAPVKKLLTRIL